MKSKNPRMTDEKYSSETYIVDEMIALYCHRKHKTKKGHECEECKELSEYCHYRLSLCPWGDKKPFCSNCSIHCYNKEHRERIRQVMRFSGPRMLFHHPILATKHVIETKREKKRLAKKQKNGTGTK